MYIKSIFISLLLILSLAAQASASMIYYSFEGTVVGMEDPQGALAIPIGTHIDGAFGVDYARLGEMYDAATGVMTSVPGTYYSTMVGSTAFSWSANRPDMSANWIQGGEVVDSLGQGYFMEYHHGMTVAVWYKVGELEIGDSLGGFYYQGTPYDYDYAVYIDLTLTAISTTNPYATPPIPGAVWLMASGLVGMFGLRSKLRG